MAFLDSFCITLDNFHLQKVRQIDRFDYSAVRSKVRRDHGLQDPELDAGIEQLKRYYAVALLDPFNLHAVSESVDPFWHSHILFTTEYIHFCNNIFGQYIHHEPLDPNDRERVAYVTKLYDYTLDTYSKIFKSIDSKWWPKSSVKASVVVCLHYDVTNEELRKAALFPRVPEFGGRP